MSPASSFGTDLRFHHYKKLFSYWSRGFKIFLQLFSFQMKTMAMFTLTRFLIFALAVSVSTGQRCPPPWKEYKRHCYFFFSTPLTFKAAETYCRNVSLSACRLSNLVSISDREEFVFVRDMVYNTIFQPLAFFMGAYTTKVCPEGTWSDGSNHPILIGGKESVVTDGCMPCGFNETVDLSSACDIDKCMVANLNTWMNSLDDGFITYVAEHRCNELQLPFVCEGNDIYDE